MYFKVRATVVLVVPIAVLLFWVEAQQMIDRGKGFRIDDGFGLVRMKLRSVKR